MEASEEAASAKDCRRSKEAMSAKDCRRSKEAMSAIEGSNGEQGWSDGEGTGEKTGDGGREKWLNPKILGFYMDNLFFIFFSQTDVCGKRLPARRP